VFTVVPAKPEDVRSIADLMEELDRFYGGTDFEPLEDRTRQIAAMLFREQPAAHVLLAKDGDRVAGFAAYSFLWPAVGLTQSLYLKELYVSQADRRNGIGTLLMEALIGVAKEADCSRVEWTTDIDNPLAIAFYKRHGYSVNEGKVLYRVGIGD
jgi:ribosomal protein S18 acetylase RimI-like enzyme